jgi:hypothetical protein
MWLFGGGCEEEMGAQGYERDFFRKMLQINTPGKRGRESSFHRDKTADNFGGLLGTNIPQLAESIRSACGIICLLFLLP